MSRFSKDTIFGISLTELVIILFFIMLLLAIFNIREVEESSIPVEKLADSLEGFYDPEEIPPSLVPPETILDMIKELVTLQKEAKGNKKGDCRDGGFWITEKCANNCWEIDNPESNRQYDYLVDIGICKNIVVVQKSKWIEKNDFDFNLVNGANELVNKKYMKAKELYSYLDTIKKPGYEKTPKQCFHNARLIALADVSHDRWENIDKQVNSKVLTYKLTKSNNMFDTVRSRFDENVCSGFD